MNYGVKLNLAKLQSVGVANIKGKTSTKACVIIPIEENHIFVSEKGGVYLDMTAIEMRAERYGQSHVVKLAIPKEVYEKMSDEERKTQEILGALSPLKARSAEVNNNIGTESVNEDELPF